MKLITFPFPSVRLGSEGTLFFDMRTDDDQRFVSCKIEPTTLYRHYGARCGREWLDAFRDHRNELEAAAVAIFEREGNPERVLITTEDLLRARGVDESSLYSGEPKEDRSNAYLRKLAESATSGGWQVVPQRHRDMYSHDLVQYWIATDWIHGQLNSFRPVVSLGLGWPEEEGGERVPMVCMDRVDADFIAAANPLRIQDLLDEIDALKAEIDRLQNAHEAVR